MEQHLRPSGDRKELVFYLLWNHLFLPSGIIGWIKVDRVWVRNCGMICLGFPRTDVMLPSHWFTSLVPGLWLAGSSWPRSSWYSRSLAPCLLLSFEDTEDTLGGDTSTQLARGGAHTQHGAGEIISRDTRETSKANKQDEIFIWGFVCPMKTGKRALRDLGQTWDWP